MKRYLPSILLFDFALPLLLIALPCGVLLWAVVAFQNLVIERAEARTAYEMQSRQVAALSAQLDPLQSKVVLLKTLLSSTDIEAKLVSGLGTGMEKVSADDLDQALHDFQYGASIIGPNYGEGRVMTLKLFSRWEALNTVTAEWETRFPNLVLQTLSIDLVPGSAISAPYLQSALSYFVVTEN
jgi:hypothetical protein